MRGANFGNGKGDVFSSYFGEVMSNILFVSLRSLPQHTIVNISLLVVVSCVRWSSGWQLWGRFVRCNASSAWHL